MQETQPQSLGWENLLEKEMATYSSILGWETPSTEETGKLQFMGLQKSDMTQELNHQHSMILDIYPNHHILTQMYFLIHLISRKIKKKMLSLEILNTKNVYKSKCAVLDI